jgi:hypothetical protein
MPEANSDPILSNPPARYPRIVPQPAEKPKLLNHNEAKTTKSYSHVLNDSGPRDVRSPVAHFKL